MPEDLSVVCKRCKTKYKVTEMTHDKNGSVICQRCYAYLYQGGQDPVPKEFVDKPKPLRNKINYICTTCHFKFSRVPDFPVVSCPFCDKKNIAILKGPI